MLFRSQPLAHALERPVVDGQTDAALCARVRKQKRNITDSHDTRRHTEDREGHSPYAQEQKLMNSEIEIVDFSEKYISDVLNVLYESNILHIKSDPDYFAKTPRFTVLSTPV